MSTNGVHYITGIFQVYLLIYIFLYLVCAIVPLLWACVHVKVCVCHSKLAVGECVILGHW